MMTKTCITVGKLFESNVLEGGTIIGLNIDGKIVYSGHFYNIPTAYFNYAIKYAYIQGGILFMDSSNELFMKGGGK